MIDLDLLSWQHLETFKNLRKQSYLVNVYPVEVHLEDRDGGVDGVLDVAKARVPRVDVGDGDDGRELPLVGTAAVEVGPGPFDRAGVLVGACDES